jgi:hypothetical protein
MHYHAWHPAIFLLLALIVVMIGWGLEERYKAFSLIECYSHRVNEIIKLQESQSSSGLTHY